MGFLTSCFPYELMKCTFNLVQGDILRFVECFIRVPRD